jgi:hypothetical protein
MKPKTFLALAAITAASIAAAGYALVREIGTTAPAAGVGEPVLSDLPARANDAETITIKSAERTISLRRADDRWVLTDKDDYPVKLDKVRELIGGLAALERLEPKTDQPDRYARLELEDVEAKDAKSRLVTVAGADGKPLAALIVGKTNYRMGPNSRGGVYVRVPGEPRAWLAEGSVDLPRQGLDLVEKTVIDVAADDLKRVVYTPAEGAAIGIAKGDKTQAEFALTPLAEGQSADADAVRRFAGGFGALSFEDVRADKAADAKPAGVTEATTFDGLAVRAEFVDLDGATWFRLTASAPEGSEAAAKAKTIADGAKGWLYKLPAYKTSALRPKLEDLLKKPDGTS